MSRFVLSSSVLTDLLDEPIKYFGQYKLDMKSVVACGITIMCDPVPGQAKHHIFNDMVQIADTRLLREEADEMFDETTRLLTDYLRQITGITRPSVELLRFLGNDPIIGVTG